MDVGGLVIFLCVQGAVPVAVPVVAGQRQSLHLPVADPGPGVIGAGIEFGAHAQPGAVLVAAMVFTMTSWLVSGRPRQFIVMWENSRCSTLFHLKVPGRCRAGSASR